MACPSLDDPRITLAGLLFEVHDGLTNRLGAKRSATSEVLIRLARSPDQSLRMSDLAAQVTMSASGLSRAIDRLVAAGSIERVACDYDRRVVHARLTDQGQAEMEAMLPEHLQQLEAAFCVLTPKERDQFEATLRKLRGQVNPEAVQASDPAPIRAGEPHPA
jgi:MarR family transcriptional regulator, 2-MHQ and catechol-resistance regulon repressor